MWMWAIASCVISVDQTVVIDEPVARIVVDVTAGDLEIRGRPGPVRISGSYGGPGGQPIGTQVDLGELVVSYDCEWCAGSLEIEAPPETALELTVGAGDLLVEGMAAELVGAVFAGSADVRGHGVGPVTLDLDGGEVDAWFAAPPTHLVVSVTAGGIEVGVPATVPYALVLDGSPVDVEGITEDPAAPNVLELATGTGSIRLRGQ